MSDAPRLDPVTQRPGAEIDDPSIPVLTDRIYLPALELDIAVPYAQPIAVPALQRSAYAEAAARPPEVAPVEIIGTVDLPAMAVADVEPAELTDVAAPVDEPIEVIGAEDRASEQTGRTQQLEAPIETELDRDLIAELDADFEALLSAEADLDAVGDAARVDTDRVETGVGVPEAIAPRAGQFVDETATAESIGPPPASHLAAQPADPPAADHAVGGTAPIAGPEDSALAGQAAVTEEGTGVTAEQPAQIAAGAAMAADVGDRGQAATESTAAVPEEAEPATATPDSRAIAEEADSLRTAVIDAVAQRLPEHIDTTMRDLMRPAIDEAVTRLGEEAQVALRISLQQLVEQVLREELERRQSGREPSAR